MGILRFQLPEPFTDESLLQELERSSVAGGQDRMPYPTEASVLGNQLLLQRDVNDSGCALIPWLMDGDGLLMTCSATLMEKATPYRLLVEMARGKVNQLRGQTADWQMGGLRLADSFFLSLRQATREFGQAIAGTGESLTNASAQAALRHAFQGSRELVQAYVSQVFEARHTQLGPLDTLLGCRLIEGPLTQLDWAAYRGAFNGICVAFPWRELEPTEDATLSWEVFDEKLAHALGQGLRVVGGPLVDFSGRDLPDWLWERDLDLTSLAQSLCDYVEAVIRRYQGKIQIWQVTAGSNTAGVLARRDDELLWLTHRLLDAVRRLNPQLECIVGLAQPWGDYLAEQERSKTPFVFADDLLRSGMRVSALDLELIMGVTPRGSYCRDLLDTSRILDLYALLGVPLRVTLGYPSSTSADLESDADQRIGLGHWGSGFTAQAQADWAAQFAALALSKPFVQGVQWCHWSDARTHHFPNCGLVDAQGIPKPAILEMTRLRREHLK